MVKTKNGITLIALVITIIVLLILAGVSISVITGENGIITKARDAKERTEIAKLQEEAEMVRLELDLDRYTNGKDVEKLKTNRLLTVLNEHFEGSDRKNNKVITSDGKYDIIVKNDLTITVQKHQDSDNLLYLEYDIFYENDDDLAPAIVEVYPYLEMNESYYDYAVKIVEGKSENELIEMFINGDVYWYPEDYVGISNVELEDVLDALGCSTLEDVWSGYDSFSAALIDMEYVEPEGYYGVLYEQYAKEIIYGKSEDEIKELFIDGQNYWNATNNYGDPIYANIDEFVKYCSETYDNNAYSDLAGMLEYWGYNSFEECAIDCWNIEPEKYFSTYGILVSCSNGQKKGTSMKDAYTEFYISEGGIYTFEAEGPNGEKEEVTISIGVVLPESIALEQNEKKLFLYEEVDLNAIILPENANYYKELVWSSSDESVAQVNDGTVTAIGAGNATITVTLIKMDNTELKATCNVKVLTESDYQDEINETLQYFTFDETTGILTAKEELVGYYYNRTFPVKNVVIPKEINGIAVTALESFDVYGVFRDMENIESVIIFAEIETISNEMFYGCSNLASVKLPESVKNFEYMGFAGCSSLENIEIPSEIVYIGEGAFYGCSSLTSISIPDNVTHLGQIAFAYCSSLKSIKIPESVTSMGNYIFEGCEKLEKAELPQNITTINFGLFRYCTNLKNVNISNNVSIISKYAFQNCTSLELIELPNSVKYINEKAFDNCTNLTNVYYEGTKSEWDLISIGNDNTPLTNATKTYNYVK